MSFSPVPADQVDPQIASHLGQDETVLWQGAPSPRTFLNPIAILACAGMVAAGLAVALGLFDRLVPLAGGPRLVPALVLIAAGAFFFYITWNNRGVRWRYAITSKRLMSVRGDRLVRSVLPGELRELRTRPGIVYWQEINPKADQHKRGPEGVYIGFHGLDDAEAMKVQIEEWREGFSQRASETAADFTAAVQGAAQGQVAEGVSRVLHPETGLTIDVPSGWRITVSEDKEGPLKILGVTLLPVLIRRGPERDYGDGQPWTSLKVRGAPDAGLYMTVRPAPLTRTLDEVVNDPWNERMGLEILQTTPEVSVGSFNGFSLVRKMPEGAVLTGFGKVENPVATRMVWLGSGGTSVELTGMARLDQPDVQHAVDAMVASLSRQ